MDSFYLHWSNYFVISPRFPLCCAYCCVQGTRAKMIEKILIAVIIILLLHFFLFISDKYSYSSKATASRYYWSIWSLQLCAAASHYFKATVAARSQILSVLLKDSFLGQLALAPLYPSNQYAIGLFSHLVQINSLGLINLQQSLTRSSIKAIQIALLVYQI